MSIKFQFRNFALAVDFRNKVLNTKPLAELEASHSTCIKFLKWQISTFVWDSDQFLALKKSWASRLTGVSMEIWSRRAITRRNMVSIIFKILNRSKIEISHFQIASTVKLAPTRTSLKTSASHWSNPLSMEQMRRYLLTAVQEQAK